jgi:putative CocE/NonD family hydrolase
MRDGIRLFTSVYVPNDALLGKTYPILMQRTPYSVAPYGADQYKTALGGTFDYEKEGFIFVFQDVRGKNMSEGEFVNMRPSAPAGGTDESTDTWDTVDWMVKHIPGNNGRVGQWGVSYPGFYTAVGAINSHPALKAVSPQAPISNWFLGDDMHRNGAFNLQLAFAFFSGFGLPRPQPTTAPRPPFDFGTPDGYQYLLDLGPLSNASKKFPGPVAFWDDVVAHPNYDGFWQVRNTLPRLKGIKAAVLTVGGWFDTEDLYGALHTYQAIEKQNPGIQNTLVMGPWTHGAWVRSPGRSVGDMDFGFDTALTYQPVELAFFKYWLKGGDAPKLPEAWVFETGANRWRGFSEWPPRAAQPRQLYLRENGGLRFDDAPTSTQAAFAEFISDPAKPVPYTTEISTHWSKDYIAADQRYVANRPDVLVFESEPLQQDLTVAGPLDVSLWVSTTGTDADWVVKLIDVYPDKMPGYTDADARAGKPNRGGQQTLIRGEPFRGRFRNGFEHPEAFVPNEPTHVAYTLNDILHTFKRGHRIMVQVHSTWFPFIDRNPQTIVPNIYQAKAEDFIKATHRVYFDAAHPSEIKLGVIPALDSDK